ncbi:hypothetical protein ACFFSY_11475 [Paenibacillus aurantiacus]|uniref:Uncharacterized protein n=1 Tax=Paenibacillus aurantiacus TaxID=1936118 RepID=A0ABV5KMU0_9BACL
MKRKLTIATILAFSVFGSSGLTPITQINAADNSPESPAWQSDIVSLPVWLEEQIITNTLVQKNQRKQNNHYNFVHKNGKTLSEGDIKPFIEGSIDVQPGENNQKSNLVGVGYYTINGKKQTEFFFSNLDETPINDLKKIAVESANTANIKTNGFTRNFSSAEEPQSTPFAAATAVPTGTSYTDVFHWAIYSDQEKLSDGSYVVAGLLDSTVDYNKTGTTVINGQSVSVWDVKASNQTRAVNGYQTRQIATRHTVEPYVPDQKLLSYGPSTTTSGANFAVSLTGGLPTISWNFTRQSVDVTDNSSLSLGYGKWTFDFPLGTAVAKGTYLMQPGIRVSNASGQVKFQHSHSGYYYKNLSYQGNGVSGLVTRNFNDL